MLHATIGVLKLSLVLDDVRVLGLLRFYLTLVCQVLALIYITVRLFFSAYVDEQYRQCCFIRSAGYCKLILLYTLYFLCFVRVCGCVHVMGLVA